MNSPFKQNCQRLQWLVFTLLVSLLALPAWSETENDDDGRLFLPSENALADVDRALATAAAKGRKALVVLGANWCHDSRALASRLQRQPLNRVISENYELVFVDVGFLEKGREVTQRFDVPIYYATPTVLIIDPQSEQLVNRDDRHRWGDAYNIGMDESLLYFEQMAMRQPPAVDSNDPPELVRLYGEVDALEARLAGRVASAYAVVGPMLAAYKAGGDPENFDAQWNEARDFRLAVPGDIEALRVEARRRVASGETGIHLETPDYPPFSWEVSRSD